MPPMRIPRYWARAEGETPPGFDGAPHVSVWGWSEESRVGAERHAQQRLTELLDAFRAGQGWPKGYAYGSRPRREEILREMKGSSGDTDAFVTRTHYGSEILNAARVLFVDVDVPWPTVKQRIARFFGSSAPMPEATTLSRIRAALAPESGGSFRIYRTAAGFRVLATDPLFTPGAPETERLMGGLGADPAYMHLCRVQDCFRARLTPKPWRCGVPDPPGRFPRSSDDEAALATWIVAYEHATQDKATCRAVEQIGWNRVHADAEDIVRLHDDRTKASANLPLA